MFASPDWDSDIYTEPEDKNPLSNYWLEGDSLAPPIHTAMDVVANMLLLTNPSESDYLVDLGCGDGRIPIEAALKYKCRSAGIEIESRLTELFSKRISDLNLCHLVQVINGDISSDEGLQQAIQNATILIVYLLPDAVEKIRPALEVVMRRSNNIRVVFNTWAPKNWKVKRSISCGFSNNSNLYLFDPSSISSEISKVKGGFLS